MRGDLLGGRGESGARLSAVDVTASMVRDVGRVHQGHVEMAFYRANRDTERPAHVRRGQPVDEVERDNGPDDRTAVGECSPRACQVG